MGIPPSSRHEAGLRMMRDALLECRKAPPASSRRSAPRVNVLIVKRPPAARSVGGVRLSIIIYYSNLCRPVCACDRLL